MYVVTVGSVDTTRVLLEAGARVNAENCLGRTAAQLGAFIGKNCTVFMCASCVLHVHVATCNTISGIRPGGGGGDSNIKKVGCSSSRLGV